MLIARYLGETIKKEGVLERIYRPHFCPPLRHLKFSRSSVIASKLRAAGTAAINFLHRPPANFAQFPKSRSSFIAPANFISPRLLGARQTAGVNGATEPPLAEGPPPRGIDSKGESIGGFKAEAARGATDKELVSGAAGQACEAGRLPPPAHH